MRGAPDTKCLPLRGMEGQKGLYRRYEAYLQCAQPKGGQGCTGGLCEEMGRQVFLCDKELEGQLGRPDGLLRVPRGDTKNHLHNQPYREPEREDTQVHQEQTVLPHRRCRYEIRIFGHEGGYQKMVDANQELGHYFKSVPYDL